MEISVKDALDIAVKRQKEGYLDGVEEIYNSIGYKIKTLNINNIYNISNVYLIECAFEKDMGNLSTWKGNLRFIKVE